MKRNTMIMVAPNGARRLKSDHPNIPLSAVELAAEAERCVAVGASAIHLHVRDEAGGHVLDAGLYREAIDAVRQRVGDKINIQITTEAVGIFTPAEQMACVRGVVPDAVSIALKEILPVDASEADIETVRAFFLWMQENKVSPQFILYEASEVERFFDLQREGIVPFFSPFLLFVLGRYTVGQQSEPNDLDPFLTAFGEAQMPWAVCAFGKKETTCAMYASQRGGHVRVGFENNLYLPDGTMADNNAEIVEAAQKVINREGAVMSASEARILLSNCLR